MDQGNSTRLAFTDEGRNPTSTVPTGMNTPPNHADEPTNRRAMIGGVWVTEEAYEFHQREISKLVKERDKAEQARDIYKYLCIGLAAMILLCVYLNSCVPVQSN
jgi:hypothetical protein